MARFATEFYKKPTEDNISNLFMHLTNYAINKDHDDYVENNLETGIEEQPSKRSMEEILEIIGYDVGEEKLEKLKFEIYDIIIKSLSMATA